jgi:hypothetical protein
MDDYIPYGMLEKEYRWELVNFHIYQYLYEIISLPGLQQVTYELVENQKIRLKLFQDIAFLRGNYLNDKRFDIDFNEGLMNLIDELYDRAISIASRIS